MNHRNIVSRWRIAKESICNQVSDLQTLSKKISEDIFAKCGQNVGYRIEVGESLVVMDGGEHLCLQYNTPRGSLEHLTVTKNSIKTHWSISLKECEELVETIGKITEMQMRQCFELSLA